MANSCSLTSSSTYQGRTMTLSCTQTKDIINNRSKISWSLTVSGGSVHYYATGPTNAYINGKKVYSKARVGVKNEFPASNKVSGASGETWVDHDSDGSKSITIRLTTAIYYGSASVKDDSKTWKLDSIARASVPTLSTKDFKIPNTTILKTNRVSTKFWHYLYFRYPNGKYGKQIASVNDSFTFDPVNTIDIKQYCKSSWSFSGRFLLRTYYGSDKIGDKTIDFIVRIPDYNLSNPTSAYIRTLSDSEHNIYTYYNGYVINGFSTIGVSFTLGDFSEAYAAEFSKCYITLVSITDQRGTHSDVKRIYQGTPTSVSGLYSVNAKITGIDFGNLNDINCGIKLSIQDTRGKIKDYLIRDPNDSSAFYIMNIKKHVSPKIQSLSLYRCDSNGDKSSIGEYVDIYYTNIIKTDILTYRIECLYKLNSQDYYGEYIQLQHQTTPPTWKENTFYDNNHELTTSKPTGWDSDINPTYTNYYIKSHIDNVGFTQRVVNNKNFYTLTDKIFNIVKNRSYDFKIKIIDYVGDYTEYGFQVSIGKTDFNLTPNGIGLGQYYDSNYPDTIQTPYNIRINNQLIHDFIFDAYKINLNGNSWYVEKYRNGIVKMYVHCTTSYHSSNVLSKSVSFPVELDGVYSAITTLNYPYSDTANANVLTANIKVEFPGKNSLNKYTQANIWQYCSSGSYTSKSKSTVSLMIMGYIS